PFSLSLVATTTLIYALSLHDALPICSIRPDVIVVRTIDRPQVAAQAAAAHGQLDAGHEPAIFCIKGVPLADAGHQRTQLQEIAADRKSTRLNSSHVKISYAVFCLKKK